MNISLSAVLVAVFSQLSPAAEWILFAGARLAAVQETAAVEQPADFAEPVAVVQVDVLPDSEAAEQLVTKIALVGDGELEVFVELVPSDVDNLPPSFGVNVGPFDSFEAAERARAQLEAAGIGGFVHELEPMLGC